MIHFLHTVISSVGTGSTEHLERLGDSLRGPSALELERESFTRTRDLRNKLDLNEIFRMCLLTLDSAYDVCVPRPHS